MTKRRIIDDGGDGPSPLQVNPPSAGTAETVEARLLPSGLFLYRWSLSSQPPSINEHERICIYLGSLISKLLLATGRRLEPFACLDGRHLDDDFFAKLRESGTPWRALMGFPLVPGVHPFRYLPIAYHINGRSAWNEVAERFVGTGGTALYLTGLSSDDFLTRLIQLLLGRDSRGATDVFPVYLPEIVLQRLETAARPTLKNMFECFEFFLCENPNAGSIDVISTRDIGDLVSAAWESSERAGS